EGPDNPKPVPPPQLRPPFRRRCTPAVAALQTESSRACRRSDFSELCEWDGVYMADRRARAVKSGFDRDVTDPGGRRFLRQRRQVRSAQFAREPPRLDANR